MRKMIKDIILNPLEIYSYDDALTFAAKAAGCDKSSVSIKRFAIDARKSDLKFVVSLLPIEIKKQEIIRTVENLQYSPIIAGFGPAGIFAALTLLESGIKPIIIERGSSAEQRSRDVNEFWTSGKLDTESNVQFGEGGAGAFSDGKLTTRINDVKCEKVLDTLIKFGAPDEIKFLSKPHIGTDKLKEILIKIREYILSNGGKIHFNTKLTDISISKNSITAVKTSKDNIDTDTVILATGHSARDTYAMLHQNGVYIEPKAFSVGLRIEHKQEFINKAMYKKFADIKHPLIKSAEYGLFTKDTNNRGVYSFCMCPGGAVIAAASEEETVVTNGMSFNARDMENANSAIAVSINTDDLQNNESDIFAGIKLQQELEKAAYYKSGMNSCYAPSQNADDYIKDTASKALVCNQSYRPGTVSFNINKILPSFINDAIKFGLTDFDKKIKGFSQGLLTGVETRTSSPVRIKRDESFQSISIKGLYPCGEGAGYAGGIISAAVDGIKIAEKIIENK